MEIRENLDIRPTRVTTIRRYDGFNLTACSDHLAKTESYFFNFYTDKICIHIYEESATFSICIFIAIIDALFSFVQIQSLVGIILVGMLSQILMKYRKIKYYTLLVELIKQLQKTL